MKVSSVVDLLVGRGAVTEEKLGETSRRNSWHIAREGEVAGPGLEGL